MPPFINFSELYNAGGSFSRQELITSGSGDNTVTTIYGGYAPRPETGPETDSLAGWLIRRLVVTKDGQRQTVECTWAKGPWTDRATLDYAFRS